MEALCPCEMSLHSATLQFLQLLLCSLIILTYEFCFLHFLPFYISSCFVIIFCISAQLYAWGIITRFYCSWIVVMWEQWLLFRECALELSHQPVHLVVVNMEITVLWDMMPCCLVDSYCFRGFCCLLLQGKGLSQVWEEVREPVPWVTLGKGQEYWLRVGGHFLRKEWLGEVIIECTRSRWMEIRIKRLKIQWPIRKQPI